MNMASKSSLILASCLAMVGCHRTFKASVSQPNPLSQPLDTLRQTEELTIVTGDMDLVRPVVPRTDRAVSIVSHRRYPLQNKASFTVVSRDRLRFHVQIEHKWKKYTDISTWKAVLTDDQGNVYHPTGIDTVKAKVLIETWSYERRTTRRNAAGAIVQVNNDGHRDPQTLGSLAVFRGRGDFVFYRRDIFSPEVRSMSLSLTRSGMTFKYTWKFADDDEPVLVATSVDSP